MNIFASLISTPEERSKVICQRLLTSTLTEDKLKALSDLHEIATSPIIYRPCIPAIPVLILDNHTNIEILHRLLHFLILCFTDKKEGEELILTTELNDDIKGNIESFCNDPKGIDSLFTLLETNSVSIRYSTLQIFIVLLMIKKEKVQSAILSLPRAINIIVDLIGDYRERIRNEAILLFEIIVNKCEEIGKIAVFSGVFEKLFDIINDESTELVIIEDCLRVAHSLLENVTNQNYFCESGLVSRLIPLLKAPDEFTESRMELLHLTLEICSLLCMSESRKSLSLSILLSSLTSFLSNNQFSDEIHFKSIEIVSNILCSLGYPNQQSLIEIICNLLNICISNDKLSLKLLHGFHKWLLNSDTQLKIANSFCPSTDSNTPSFGQEIVRSIKADIRLPEKAKWNLLYIISFILENNQDTKRFLLNVPISIPEVGSSSKEILLTVIISTLEDSVLKLKFDTVIAGLIVLAIWSDSCSEAAKYIIEHHEKTITSLSISHFEQQKSYINVFIQGISSCILVHSIDKSSIPLSLLTSNIENLKGSLNDIATKMDGFFDTNPISHFINQMQEILDVHIRSLFITKETKLETCVNPDLNLNSLGTRVLQLETEIKNRDRTIDELRKDIEKLKENQKEPELSKKYATLESKYFHLLAQHDELLVLLAKTDMEKEQMKQRLHDISLP